MSHERRIPVAISPEGHDLLAACGRVLGQSLNSMLDKAVEALAIQQGTTVARLTGGHKFRATRGDRAHLRRGTSDRRRPPGSGSRFRRGPTGYARDLV
jgi:hypothetical protein